MPRFSRTTTAAVTCAASLVVATIAAVAGARIDSTIAIVAVLIVAGVLVLRGFVTVRSVTNEQDYFTAASVLKSRDTHDSIGSTWIMLGNVVVANMVLAQLLGVATIWMLVTWAWAFFVLSRHARVIRERPEQGATLHAFLRSAYDSRPMQVVAATVTIFTGIGVFSIELLLGLALVGAFWPDANATTFAGLLIGVTVIAMAITAMTGGFRAIVESDSLLWPIVIVATLALPLLAILGADPVAFKAVTWRTRLLPPTLDGPAIASFFVGIFFLQVPLLVGDYGTWQRVRATRHDETVRLGRKLVSLGVWQAVLWGAPVVAGMLLIGMPDIDNGRSGQVHSVGGPIIELTRRWMEAHSVPLAVRAAIALITLVGLISVMITTADGYLMIALEAWVRDIRPRELAEKETASRARRLALVFAVVATLPVFYLVRTSGSLLGLISTFFGALVALSTPALLALYDADHARAWSRQVVLATFGGFAFTLVLGFWLTFWIPDGAAWDWWRTFGVFLAPIPAMIVPFLTVLSLYALEGEWASLGMFLRQMFSPFVRVSPHHER